MKGIYNNIVLYIYPIRLPHFLEQTYKKKSLADAFVTKHYPFINQPRNVFASAHLDLVSLFHLPMLQEKNHPFISPLLAINTLAPFSLDTEIFATSSSSTMRSAG